VKPTLLVLAAGIGSRYGGLKQIDPVGPGGETIIDYSVFDAIRAGFGKVVFVIRRDIEADFKAVFGQRFANQIPVEYVFQELTMLPPGFSAPPNRTKPWGTGHAILMARDVIKEPFVALNADDFYGANSFQSLADYLQSVPLHAAEYAMVGFILRNTLSDFGAVSRGVCQTDQDGFLRQVVELTKITKDGARAKYSDDSGQEHPLTADEIVSMNIWGFTPFIFDQLEQQFLEFLKTQGRQEKSELYIPTVVNTLVSGQQARVKVLASREVWFGVTYQEDRPHVIQNIQKLIAQGVYPEKLWSA
jgi:NDP-sugar pyrophosphorylase family protein